MQRFLLDVQEIFLLLDENGCYLKLRNPRLISRALISEGLTWANEAKVRRAVALRRARRG